MKLFYTQHAINRMKERLITEDEVIQALNEGKPDKQESEKYSIEYKFIKIVFVHSKEENLITIVTVLPSKHFSKQIKRYSRIYNTSIKFATKLLKGGAK